MMRTRLHASQRLTTRPANADAGVALITTLAIVIVVTLLIVGSTLTTEFELALTRNDRSSAQAQYLAQAGLQTYKATLFQAYRSAVGNEASNADLCDTTITDGLDLFQTGAADQWQNVNGALILGPFSETLSGVGADGAGIPIGSYTVRLIQDASLGSRISIVSVGETVADNRGQRATSTALATFIVGQNAVLEQAIFAGSGSAMGFVNGNARVFGGIYVVGNASQPDAVVMNPSGSFALLNGYSTSMQQAPTGLGTYIDPARRNAPNLCASLRVQHGRVTIGSSATRLGEPSNRLLNVAVGRPGDLTRLNEPVFFDSDDPVANAFCTTNNRICSEAGVTAFDLTDPPGFPRLDDVVDTSLCPGPDTWRTCLRDDAIADGIRVTRLDGGGFQIETSDGILDANDVPAGCSALFGGAAASGTVQFAGTAQSCQIAVDGRTVGFTYTPSGSGNNAIGTLNVTGNLNLVGFDLTFSRDVRYNATSLNGNNAGIYVESSPSRPSTSPHNVVRIQGDFTVQQPNTFPNNTLAIVAEGDVRVGGSPNDVVTAPIYSGETFHILGNTVLYGQVITNSFCSVSNAESSSCATAGNPADIVYVSTAGNRPAAFAAIADQGGTPTFTLVSYEMR